MTFSMTLVLANVFLDGCCGMRGVYMGAVLNSVTPGSDFELLNL